MLADIKELFQAFIAPALEGIRGDIRALEARIEAVDSKFEAKFDALDTKLESYRRELLAEIHQSSRCYPLILCGWSRRSIFD